MDASTDEEFTSDSDTDGESRDEDLVLTISDSTRSDDTQCSTVELLGRKTARLELEDQFELEKLLV